VPFIRDALEQDSEADITHRDIGGALGCHHNSIQQQLRKFAKTPNLNGHPRLLPPAAYQWIVETATQQFCDRRPMTSDKLMEQIEAKHDISLSNDALWHILQRMPELKVVEGTSMEKEPILVRLEHIQY
jgi:transposase